MSVHHGSGQLAPQTIHLEQPDAVLSGDLGGLRARDAHVLGEDRPEPFERGIRETRGEERRRGSPED